MQPFRFGVSLGHQRTAAEYGTAARRAEESGYSTLLVPDHLTSMAPLPACAAVAAATESLRAGTMVINNDFRHPALLAQEVATVDLLSDGRFELGLGAGWTRSEYEGAGIPFERAADRIARLEESVQVLRRLFAGETVTFAGNHYSLDDHVLAPLPPQGAALPIAIGGNGKRLLELAGRQADIVNFTGFFADVGEITISHWSEEALSNRLDIVRHAAGDRFGDIELSILVQHAAVTPHPRGLAGELFAQAALSADDVLDSPFVLMGSVNDIVAKLQRLRDESGISYIVVFEGRNEAFEAVVERLAGE